jgi:hypothetical protein
METRASKYYTSKSRDPKTEERNGEVLTKEDGAKLEE